MVARLMVQSTAEWQEAIVTGMLALGGLYRKSGRGGIHAGT